jgi:hypothetical protein
MGWNLESPRESEEKAWYTEEVPEERMYWSNQWILRKIIITLSPTLLFMILFALTFLLLHFLGVLIYSYEYCTIQSAAFYLGLGILMSSKEEFLIGVIVSLPLL